MMTCEKCGFQVEESAKFCSECGTGQTSSRKPMYPTYEGKEYRNDQEIRARIERGLEYNHLGQYEQAIRDFDEVIRLDPQDAAVYYNRGLAYGRIGNSIEAERDFAQAKELGYEP